MKKNLHIIIGKAGEKYINFCKNFFIVGVMLAPTLLRASELNWNGSGGNNAIETWFNTILLVIMGVFVMTAVIMGSLAFKQLASDGNWKDFWSKIAGAIGMFVVPIAIYWIRGKSNP